MKPIMIHLCSRVSWSGKSGKKGGLQDEIRIWAYLLVQSSRTIYGQFPKFFLVPRRRW